MRVKTRFRCSAIFRCSAAVQIRDAHAHQDQPDGVPAAEVFRDAAAYQRTHRTTATTTSSASSRRSEGFDADARRSRRCRRCRPRCRRAEQRRAADRRAGRPAVEPDVTAWTGCTRMRACPTPSPRPIGIVLGAREDGGPKPMCARARRPARSPKCGAALGVPLRRCAARCGPASSASSRDTYSRTDQTAAEVADDIGQDLDLSRLLQEMPPIEDLLEGEDDAPIIRMINALFTQALREGASDIHIEPFETRSVVRFRIDGMLRDLIEPHRALHAAMVSRIKIMAQLDIAEKRLPQDGRITLRVAGKPIDVRVSTIPTGHGERVVLRLLDKEPARLDLRVLGMDDGHAGADRQADPPAARHRPGHRPHRLGQDHHAVRGACPARRRRAQHHDGRGSDRIRPRRHQPDPGQRAHRYDVRAARCAPSCARTRTSS